LNKTIQNKLEYYPFIALIALLKALPYSFSKAMICGLFDLVGYRFGVRKDVARKQMQKVYPDWSDEQLNRTLREMYRLMALNVCETYLMDDVTLNARSTISGMEYVDEALSLGNGAILATAHFGNWEAARILPLKNIPVSVITKRQRNRLFDSYTNAIRERNGVHTIDMRKGLRDILHDLKQNWVVANLADQNAHSSGLVLDFLGFPASHWKGVAKLSLRYKIPIFAGFVVRQPDDTLQFEFRPMLYWPELQDKEENYSKVIMEINRITEEFIHQYPEQWFWVHKRWKYATDMFS